MGKRKTRPEQELTRKQILISRREKEQLRYIYMGLGLVAVLVILVLAFGAVQTFILEPNSPVAIVNGTEISTGDYRTKAQYERFLLGQQYQQLLAQQASFAQSGDEQLAQMLQSQFQQYSAQLAQQLSSVDQTTLDTMIDDLLIKADADAKGITVSEEEVDEFINRFLARREGGLTASAASETATAVVDASATAALWTPTPTFTPSPTLTTTESITPTATPADTPTPAPTPTPNVIDENDLSTAYQNWLVTLDNEAGVDEAAYRSFVRSLVLRTKHQEALGEEVPTVAEQSHARHILVETEEEAQTIIERLNAGEDFATLAEELSTDPGSASQGGDLGFVSRGDFVEAVDEAVFTLPIGEISEPIETEFGWHVIEVLEREERELSPGDYSRQQQVAYNDWLTETRTSADIQNLWTPDKAPSGSPLDILNDITPPTPLSGS